MPPSCPVRDPGRAPEPRDAVGPALSGWLRAGLSAVALVFLAAVVAFAVLAQRALHRREAGRWANRQLPAFALTDQLGRPFGHETLAGCPAVVSFVFTGCSVSCLQVSRRMQEIQAALAARPEVRLVSLTVDPRSDTPEVLLEFGGRFQADPERWRLLTGPPAEVDRVVGALLDPVPSGAWSEMPGGFLGTEKILVLDAAGRVRAAFDGQKSGTPAAVLEALATLPPTRR